MYTHISEQDQCVLSYDPPWFLIILSNIAIWSSRRDQQVRFCWGLIILALILAVLTWAYYQDKEVAAVGAGHHWSRQFRRVYAVQWDGYLLFLLHCMALHMVVLMDEHTNAIPLMALVLNIA